MARSIIFVNDSGTPWVLTRLGGITVPATGIYDATAVISDDELTSAIQKGLSVEFDSQHYLRVNGQDLTAAESAVIATGPHAPSHDMGGEDPTTPGLSSGILFGGNLSVNGVDDTKFDLTAGYGIIVNNVSDPEHPTIKLVAWDAMIGIDDPYIASSTETYICVDENGDLVFHTDPPTPEDRRDHIHIGWTSHPDYVTLEDAYTEPLFASDVQCQLDDFFDSFGAFNVDGNIYAPQANLKIERSAGITFDSGSNYRNSAKNPHRLTTDHESPIAELWYFYRDPGDPSGWKNDLPVVADVDPEHWDDGTGVLATVSAGKFTIQMISFYAPWDATDIQYGQEVYDTLELALAAIPPSPVLNPWNADWDTLRGWMIVKQGATDLTDPAQARFIAVSRFGMIQSVGSGGVVGEVNTASNQGLSGQGLFLAKSGVDLQFKNIRAASTKVTVTNNAGQKTVDVDVSEANLTLGNMGGTISDTQHGSRGGGTLHAAVVAGVSAGFMSAADKTKLDGVVAGFGGGFQQGSSDTASSWSGDENYRQKLRVTTPSLPAGTYRIGWHFEFAMDTVSYRGGVRGQINDSVTMFEVAEEFKDTDNWNPGSGYYYHTLASPAVLNLDMDYKTYNASYAVGIRRARLEIWRVS